MKPLHILDHSYPIHSGYSFRSGMILNAQRKLGWEPVALTSAKHQFHDPGRNANVETHNDVRFYRTFIRTKTGNSGFLSQLRVIRSLRNAVPSVISKEEPHLIHAHSPVLNYFGAKAASAGNRLPLIYEIRAFWEDAGVDHGTYRENSAKYRFVQMLETLACRKAARVVVICHGLRDDLTRRGIDGAKIAVVANGIDVEKFQPCAPDPQFMGDWQIAGKKVIGFMGSFYHYEGIELLVDAFAEICKIRSDCILLLAGGGPQQDFLFSKVKKLNLEDRVIRPGRIANDRIPAIYELIDVLVYPRHAIRLTELVTPLKPLEAMAMAKPIVASNVGGHRELIQDGTTGLLVTPGNPDSLIKAIVQLLDNVELRRSLGNRGRAWVCKERTWDKVTAPYIQIYETALRDHSAHRSK